MVIEVTDMVAEENRVVAYWTITATHEVEAFGVPPTGKKITVNAISQLRWLDGQVVEYQAMADLVSFYRQVRLLQTPAG